MTKKRSLGLSTRRRQGKPQVVYPHCESVADQIDLVSRVVGHLNSCIDPTTKKIPYNCKLAWGPTVNSFTTRNWVDILTFVEDIYLNSEYCTDDQYGILADAAFILKEYPNHDRVLNEYKHRTTAWKALMTVREIYNDIQGWSAPKGGTGPATNFTNLFD